MSIQYDVRDADCDVLNLDGEDCDTFESGVGSAQGAVAAVILLLIFKSLLLWMSYCNTRNRILWILMIVAGGGDIVLGCLCFAACGDFNTVMEEFPDSTLGEYEVGWGWGLFLLSGFFAWITAALAVVVLIKGTGENSEKSEAPESSA